MRYARIAARHFGLDLREHYITPDDIAGSMRDIARATTSPSATLSAVPTFACARRAHADGVRIMLAGDGGDEIFAGKRTLRAPVPVRALPRASLAALRAGLVEPLLLKLPISTWTRADAEAAQPCYRAGARAHARAARDSDNFIQRMTPQALFEPDFLAHVDTARPLGILEASYGAAPAAALVNRMMYLDWKVTLADNDLRKVGRMCELAGIDVRYPMLDDALIDLSAAACPHASSSRGRRCAIYKRALRDFLPREIIEKTKHGFGLPFGVWLASSPDLQALVYGSLDALKQRSILRPDFCRSAAREPARRACRLLR